jgi:lipopolysaccharide assembly outer membrane protein LptD (OstA)
VKHVSLAVLACWALVLIPNVASPQDARPTLHLPAPTDGMSVNLSANSMRRSDPPNSGASPYASDVQLKGDVEIRMCCVQRPTSKARKGTTRSEMIMHADQAEYHGATGEIVAHGTVRVNFQDPR